MPFLILLALAFGSFSQAALSTKTLAVLHPMEAQVTQAWHAGYLWEGDMGEKAVRVFSGEGKQIALIPIPHFIRFVIAGDANHILVSGKHGDEIESFVSTIDVKTFKVTTRKISEPIFSISIVADGKNRIYFGDVPEKSMAFIQGNTIRRFSSEIITPSHVALLGDSLWVVEALGLASPKANLAKVNLKTGILERVFDPAQTRGTLYKLFAWTKKNLVAASETSLNQVILVNASTQKLASVIPVEGFPRALAGYGKCLAVLSEGSRQLHFFNVEKANELVDTWDFSDLGGTLQNPHAMHTDETTGRVYLRSSIACMSADCSAEANAVVLAENPESPAKNICLR